MCHRAWVVPPYEGCVANALREMGADVLGGCPHPFSTLAVDPAWWFGQCYLPHLKTGAPSSCVIPLAESRPSSPPAALSQQGCTSRLRGASAATRDPVVLVADTFSPGFAMEPLATRPRDDGYDVTIFELPTLGTQDINLTSQALAAFVDGVRSRKGAVKVDLVGSQPGRHSRARLRQELRRGLEGRQPRDSRSAQPGHVDG